jgi:hypothetical protein
MFEEKKEDLIAKIPGILHSAGRRKNRRAALSIGAISTLSMWVGVLLAPHQLYRFFSFLFWLRSDLFKLIFLIPMALGFTLAYAVLMIRQTDLDCENIVEEGVMGHYAYQQRSDRGWLVWLLAGMFGAANTIVMVAVDLLLVE